MHWYRDKRDRMLKEADGVEGGYPVLQDLSLKIVVFSKTQYRYLGTSGSSVSIILFWLINNYSDTHADVTSLVTCRCCGSWLAKRTLLESAIRQQVVSEIFCSGTMPVSCCVINCTRRFEKGSGITFFRIPDREPKRSAWIKSLMQFVERTGCLQSTSAFAVYIFFRVSSNFASCFQ